MEGCDLFANITLVQNYRIMSESPELKLLDRRNYSSDIIAFTKDTEAQNEDRIDGVNFCQTVVAAFIGVYDVIAKLPIHRTSSKNSRV
jgi:hypothetical protein